MQRHRAGCGRIRAGRRLKALVTGNPAKHTKSSVERQRERIDWLKTHLGDALAHLKIAHTGRWTVAGAIVTSNVVPIALRKTAVPILSSEELRQLIAELGPELRFP